MDGYIDLNFVIVKSLYLPPSKFDEMKKKIWIAALLLSTGMVFAQRNGGMWIPNELNETEMKELGMKISAKDIFNTSKPSIKDAVVHFNGGCTAEIISPQGLLLTNHHCGYGQIQAHSTVDNDLLTNGFWAKNQKGELPNPGMYVDFIVDIQNVTDKILNGNGSDASIQQNIRQVQQQLKKNNFQEVIVKPLFAGNQYYAFVTQRFKDIRLVGAPPQSIGKFGSDTDNWVWPRHTGDFSMFRIYADKNNNPAEYSKDNVPYKPKYFLPVSIRDLKENDFTFVFGFPGRTQEYLPSIAVQKVVEEIDPAMISVRDIALKILDEKMRADAATRIKYASKYASIANYRKKWQGEVEGLKKSNAVAKKVAYEQQLILKNPEIKATLAKFDELYKAQAPYALNRAYYNEVMRNAETLRLAQLLGNYAANLKKGGASTASKESLSKYLSNFYKDYDPVLDAKVTASLLSLYQTQTPASFQPENFAQFANLQQNLQTIENWSANSVITGRKTVNGQSVSENPAVFLANPDFVNLVENDPFVKVALAMQAGYQSKVESNFARYEKQIDDLQRTYMKQLMDTDKNTQFFPDANSTLRVAYGVVKGSNPRDAVYYGYQTHLSGVMEKYIPGDYEFDVPEKLIQLYNNKDFGPYKDSTGDVPVNFTATNHTTGGNSGSPVIDANGNLIGLNFDRQWEGTMSDINFDPRFSRNIMVATKYVLFIVDKYADARWLLDEMKIVN